MSSDSVAETQSGIVVPLYKVLVNGASCHGGNMTWPLPVQAEDGAWTPGAWVSLDANRPLVLCEYALHLTDQPAAWYVNDAQCWQAEYRGEIVGAVDGGRESKIGVREARLLRRVEWSDAGVWSDGQHTIASGAARASDTVTVRALGNATVHASGNATVRALDSVTVRAFDTVTVRALGNATVDASGNATVRASNDVTVYASSNATVHASGNATVRALDSVTVSASNDVTVYAYDNVTVHASDNVTVHASDTATVDASGNATVRASNDVTVYAYDNVTVHASNDVTVHASDNVTVHASDNVTVVSPKWHNNAATVALSEQAVHVDRRGGTVVCRVAEAAS